MTRIIVIVSLLAGSAFAQDRDESFEELARGLDLTPQQRQQIRDIADDAKKEKVRARAEMEVLEIDLRRELDREAPDERKVADLVEKLAAAEGRTRKARILASLRVKKILAAEQRAALEAEKRAPKRAAPADRVKNLKDPFPGPDAAKRDDLVSPFGGSNAYETAMKEAKVAYANREYGKALARAEDAAELAPGDAEAHTVAAMAACKLKNPYVVRKHESRLKGQRVGLVRQICAHERVDLDAPSGVGTLTLNTQPWARVVIDGKDTGLMTPVRSLEIAPGKHVVTFVVGSKKFAYPVVIEPGQELKLIKKLNIDESGGVFVEPGYLTLAASPYANVFVDGDLVGATPIFKHPLAPGRHTIKAVTADGKTQTIVVTVESGRESTHRLSW